MNRTGALSVASIPDATDVVLVTMALNQSIWVSGIDLYNATVSGGATVELYVETSFDGASWVRAGPNVPVYAPSPRR